MTTAGVFTVLHTFGPAGAPPYYPNSDGSRPSSDGLTLGSDGTLYGVTLTGGAGGYGTIFSITPAGVFTVLHAFSEVVGDNFTNADGASAYGLTLGADGKFYGCTGGGGPNGRGTFFSLTTAGKLSTLYNFGGTDSGGRLVQAKNGTFFGVGGSGANGAGTIFSITPAGAYTLLHTFAAYDHDGDINSDGYAPIGLILGADGNFYGVTQYGGSTGDGVFFSMTASGQFTLLYTFGYDSLWPETTLLQASDGGFYGTSSEGGDNGTGSIFKLTTVQHPAFFAGEVSLGNDVCYLGFPDNNYFGYYSFLGDPNYIYHDDLGYEYVFDAKDNNAGVYLYDFASKTFFYTSPVFPFPYLYDFTLNTVLYYYPDPNHPGHYNTNGVRYFYDFNTGQTIVK